METFRKGDIVLFPFPYTNLKGRRLRPCLVISDVMREDIILCQVTSQNIQSNEHSIELLKEETKEGTLMIDSFIRCNMIFTASKEQILKVICKIDRKKYNEVIKRINKIISGK